VHATVAAAVIPPLAGLMVLLEVFTGRLKLTELAVVFVIVVTVPE
jgi:H+/Cl- antiporter ClcA